MKIKRDSLLCGWLGVLAAGLPIAVLGQANYSTPYTFTTLAGRTGEGSADGTNSAAQFAHPYGAALDGAGNLYVADTGNNTIRKATPVGTNWVVTTLAGLAGVAGSADGMGNAARFASPFGVAVDTNGNVYVADGGNSTIRKVTPVGTNWVVTTLAGRAGVAGTLNGTNSAARFNSPSGVAVDGAGNLYVADLLNDTIRKVAPVGTNWVVSLLAGAPGAAGSADGTGSAAQFDYPRGVAVDSAGNVYVADENNSTLRKVTPAGKVTTLAGLAGNSGTNDGTGSTARFYSPHAVAVDSARNVYVADTYNFTVRKVVPVGANWVVTTLAGLGGSSGTNDGTGSAARFCFPNGLTVDSAGNVYLADTWNFAIRNVTPAGVVTTLAGRATTTTFNAPLAVALDSAGNVYVADFGNDTILKVTPAGEATTLAGLAGSPGSADGTNSAATFNAPAGLAVDSAGNLYVADWGNHTIRKMTPVGTDWVVTTLAGRAGQMGSANGTNSAARFYHPGGVAVDSAGNVYVADAWNDTIRKITPAGTNWVVTTLAGVAGDAGTSDGTGSGARFNDPWAMALDSAGNLYVTDWGNSTIRKVTAQGQVTLLAGAPGVAGSADGTNNAARFNYPYGLAVDGAGNLYVGDTSNYTLRKVTPVGANWVVTTMGGLVGGFGSEDGTGSAARFWDPFGVAVDSAGNVYVADNNSAAIRKGMPASSVPAPNLEPPSLSAGQFSFGITGLPGLPVAIEASADLSQWQVVGACTLVGGTNYFVSPNPSQGLQFYRGHVR